MNVKEAASLDIAISLLGTPQCSLAGQAPQRLERKAAAAAFLAVASQDHSREQVAGLLWPGSSSERARTSMRVMLHRLRKTLGAPMFADGSRWALVPNASADMGSFLSAPMVPFDAEAALSRPLLAGADYTDLPEFCELLRETQERITEQSIQALVAHAERCLDVAMDAPLALRAASLVLSYHPTNEAACRAKMRAQMTLGDRAGALSTYESCRAEIARIFESSPEQQTRLLQLEILRADQRPLQDLPTLSGVASEVLRSPRIVGRESVIAKLLECARDHRHAWLLGEAGMGKSRVIEELLLRSPAVRLSCRPNDDDHPYAIIKRLIRHLQRETESETDTDMASLLAAAANTESSPVDLERVFTASLQALQQLRRDGVPLLIIDDLHYIDMASARVVCALCEHVDRGHDRSGIPSILFAARPQHLNAAYAKVQRAAETARCFEQVMLTGLGLDDTLVWLRELAVPWLDPQSCAARLQSLSGGNPFFMLEIVRAARSTDDPNALSMRMDSIVGMLASRISTASCDAAGLADLLAVAGSDYHLRMPLEVLQFSHAQLACAWHELKVLGIVNARGFSHDLAMSAAQGRVIGVHSQLLHEGIAQFLVREKASPVRIATHLLAGTNPGLCMPHVVAAAKSLWRDGLVAEAFALVDRAAEFVPAAASRTDAFDLLWCRHYLLVSGQPRATHPQSLDLLRRAAFTAKQRIMVDFAEMRLLVQWPGGLPKMLEIGARYAATRQSDDSYWREIRCLHALALVLSNELSQASDVYDDIRRWPMATPAKLAREDFALASSSKPTLALTAFALGHTNEAVAWMVRAVSDADDQALPLLQLRLRNQLAEIYGYQGRLPLAIATLSQAMKVDSSRRMSSPRRSIADALQVRLMISWGQLDAAKKNLDALHGRDWASVPAGWRMLTAMLWNHACGDIETARELRLALQASPPPEWFGFERMMQCLSAAMTLAEGGDPSELIEGSLASPEVDLTHNRSFLRLIRCRRLPAEQACQEAETLVGLMQQAGLRGYELAAWTELSDACARLGRLDEARRHLEEALGLSHEATPLAVTRADQAGRMHEVMRACAHPAALPWHRQWREWRDAMCAAVPELDAQRFRCRYAWIDE